MYTVKGGIFFLGSCVTAIAAVGSMFELGYGEPDLGAMPTTIILGLCLPLSVILLLAAIREGRANQE
ncbi:MAG: hypothetical protein QNJ46_13820 [Leptolyngbyaceae cyanobacterium MO_188.B28]|nr:hypothetical protein [Leptolyngbyaceae cyanobacterium MO_188.B28]